MIPIDTLPFSSEFATIVVETNRHIDTTLNKKFGFSSTDYCILQQLYVAEGEIRLSDLQNLFLLKKNSITAAVLRLEERGLVIKHPIEGDLRSFGLTITSEGTRDAEAASAEIRKDLEQMSWYNDPEDPRINDCIVIHADIFFGKRQRMVPQRKSLAKDYYILPGWILGIKEIQKEWTDTLKRRFDLSFGEYRSLAFLIETGESQSSKAIVDRLFLNQSMVSVIVKKLVKDGYVVSRTDRTDKRCSDIEATEEGRRFQKEAFDALTEVTAAHFKGMDPTDAETLNQWHLEMCAALYR